MFGGMMAGFIPCVQGTLRHAAGAFISHGMTRKATEPADPGALPQKMPTRVHYCLKVPTHAHYCLKAPPRN